MSTPENATQSKTSVSQTETSEENIHREQPSIFNPFQKEILTYLVEGFKVSIVSKLIKWGLFIHTGAEGPAVCSTCFEGIIRRCAAPPHSHAADTPSPPQLFAFPACPPTREAALPVTPGPDDHRSASCLCEFFTYVTRVILIQCFI